MVMQEQKLSVNDRVENTNLSSKQDSSALLVTKQKKRTSIQILGLIASVSSIGATVSFHQPAAAKTFIFDNDGNTPITTLPSLEPSTIANPLETSVSSAVLINSNLDREFSDREITEIPALVAKITKKEVRKNIYTVKPGDTIHGIARKYGISSSQIIEANKLTNPNSIDINLQLVIPNIELAQESSYQRITAPTQPPAISPTEGREFSINNNFTTSDSKKSASLSSLAEKKAQSRSKKQPQATIADTSSKNERLTPSETTVIETKIKDPYISKLRQDIIKLRTKYQQQNGDSETIAVIAPTKPSDTTPTKITPENTISENNSLTERESVAKVETVENKATNLQSPQPTIASAPTPATNFPFDLSTIRTNIPDLPPLASPEEYLPDHPIFDGYMWPAKGTLTSGYGWRWGRMHKGIDIAAPIGTPIMAAASGEVIFAGWNSGGYGNLVKLRHPDGSVTLYAHNNRVMVRNGQRVRQGQLIAEMGSTGRSTGPHLHFEIRPNGSTAINPMARLPRQR